MENNRVVPKTRPRPYDLRRKVLLKNFLREQMYHMSAVRLSAPATLEVNDSTLDQDLPNSISNDEKILTPKQVQDNIVSSLSSPEPTPSTSTFNEKENSNNFDNVSSDQSVDNTETDSRPSPKFPRLSNLLGMRKKHKNGIKKAKHSLKTLKGAHKPVVKGITNKMKISERPKEKRSFFSMFKSRREKKRNIMSSVEKINTFGSQKSGNNESQVSNTSTQSVQTDISWSPGAYELLEQSNKSLLEENRLLSESLSSMISNTDLKLGSKNNSYCTDLYNSSNNLELYSSSKDKHSFDAHSNTNYSWQSQNSKSRVLRSKSMQERCERKSFASSRLRARSMNRGYFNKPLDTSYSTKEPFSNRLRFPNKLDDRLNFPRAKKLLPVPNSSRVLPIRKANDSSILKTLPSNNSGKVIVRRSSMPERTTNWNNKSRRPTRSNSVRENHNLRASQRITFRPKQSSSCSVSNGKSEYLCPLSVQDLPAEAFY
ncbi:uncharacterized protein TNIN_483401 [Trichonephila inaurata madagascariensis]|uniref:Uncharacterized protein n=1 Tax=Trichonephila inaurata madagascariensis TaxID=2747483 RepID=A0A8X7CGY4_9ARAC|nr:uncharacterized protein TNIN_483401 [Trichonephila inaurata madagascariensis]